MTLDDRRMADEVMHDVSLTSNERHELLQALLSSPYDYDTNIEARNSAEAKLRSAPACAVRCEG